jgi:hypothetical protein
VNPLILFNCHIFKYSVQNECRSALFSSQMHQYQYRIDTYHGQQQHHLSRIVAVTCLCTWYSYSHRIPYRKRTCSSSIIPINKLQATVLARKSHSTHCHCGTGEMLEVDSETTGTENSEYQVPGTDLRLQGTSFPVEHKRIHQVR